MKILHAIATLDPASGGPAAVALSLGLAQARLGEEVTIACQAEPGLAGWVAPWISRLASNELLKIKTVGAEGLAERMFASATRRGIAALVADADVVHLHGLWRGFHIVVCQEALNCSKRLVVTPHGMLDPWSLQQRWLKKRIALLLIWRKILDRAHFIHALNQTEADLVAQLALRCPMKVIANGIDKELQALPRDPTFRERHLAGSKRPYVLFLGRLHYKKGLDYLIEAFEWLSRVDQDTDLVIAGPDDGMRASLTQWIAERNLGNRVYLVGPLYGATKLAALSEASCFCLPSRQEGFSIAILEALACGLPVVISEGCHFPEVVDAGCGLQVPLQAAAIGAGLKRYLGDAAFRTRSGLAGQRLVLDHYQWSSIASAACTAYG
jgi:glycosyltransferase involved in cell wall biosynthesis